MFEKAALSDLTGFYFGNAQNELTGTGCTVVLCPEGAVCGVDVRGAAPATRETDLLKPEKTVQRVNAVVLSGGSAFGLLSSSGVMSYLAKKQIGLRVGKAVVPIVVGASLFDLNVGENSYPDEACGYEACVNAMSLNAEFVQGNVGAGCGASSAKLLGEDLAMKTGLGYHVCKHGEVVVAAVVAVNALGSVRDCSGSWIAGPVNKHGEFLDGFSAMQEFVTGSMSSKSGQDELIKDEEFAHGIFQNIAPSSNTTLGVIITNAELTKANAAHISCVAHDAYARSIYPVHTNMDGDAIFTMAHGCVKANVDALGMMACEAMQQAIQKSVVSSKSAFGLMAACDAIFVGTSK